MPKFRGNSEDWLDDNAADALRQKASHRQKNPNLAKAVELPLEQSNALVTEVFMGQCRVRIDEDQSEILCSYRRAGIIPGKYQKEKRERAPLAVGDRVLAKKLNPQAGVVEGICKRRNALYRVAPGREEENTLHIIAANIDLLLVVAAADLPSFNPTLVDRFLVAAETESIPAALCITKMDLFTGSTINSPAPLWRGYENIGYPVFEISVKEKESSARMWHALRNQLKGKTVVFCGQSGVGKTSLLRELTGKQMGRIGEVNAVTGKGRHTTTGATLVAGIENEPGQVPTYWIDTPGIKEFALAQVQPENLKHYYPEFRTLNCETLECSHQEESGCKARELFRWESYCKILNTLK